MLRIFILSIFVCVSFLFCTNVNAETGADLIVSDIQVNSNESGNEIVVTVKNIGDANSNLNSGLTLTYGTNFSVIESCKVGKCSVGNKYNASIYTSAYGKNTLSPGEKYDIIFNDLSYLLDQVEFDAGVSYLIKAVVDDNQIISEINENNNTYSKKFMLGAELDENDKKIIKEKGSPNIYYIENNKKRPILSAAVFESYGFKWGDVVEVEDSSVYSDGEMLANADYKLVKYKDSSKVYLIENNKKRWITNEDVFVARRYGWGFIETLDSAEVYDNGENIDSKILEGDLVKYEGSSKVYLIEGNKKRWITTEDAFAKKGYLWSDIYVVPSNESNFEDGQDIVN